MSRQLRILFIGDVCGEPGRRCVRDLLPGLRAEHRIDVVVANGENATRGLGLGARHAQQLLSWGIDGITLGNHSFRQRDIFPMLNTHDRIVRPANLARRAPGHGTMYLPIDGGGELAVINVMGSIYLDVPTGPFEVIDELVDAARARTQLVLVDIHAEATSEKVAMGAYLAGRATAVVGTHTHVQTSDARLLGEHTAFVTDVGMTGPHDSVIGVRTEIILRRFTTGLGERFEVADGGAQLEAVIIEADADSGAASSISTLRVALGQ